MGFDDTAGDVAIFVAFVITVGLAIVIFQALGHLRDISAKLSKLLAATEDVVDELADTPADRP